MHLSDIKADLSRASSVLGIVEEMVLDINLPREVSPALRAQVEALQALLDLLRPFVRKLNDDIDLFDDNIEAERRKFGEDRR